MASESFMPLFVPTCLALNLAPGPNNLLSVRNGAQFGFRRACSGGIGRLAAFSAMILVVAIGLGSALQFSAAAARLVRFAGGGYLVFLALQMWQSPGFITDGLRPDSRKIRNLVWQEFLVAGSNPKALLIFTAFLPQFLDQQGDLGWQFLVLGAIFLGLESFAICVYAYAGSRVASFYLQGRGVRTVSRCCALLLLAVGAAMLESALADSGVQVEGVKPSPLHPSLPTP